ncbi:MAG: hypothetical protein IIB07_03380 [Bacteroidetes bacterium]|nr:hypothetical protein [Bacteroidota bacterium]MCH8170158.1 hypothetical protein [Bacteroidota bacterium]
MILLIVGLIVFVFNIPFGYWRANTKKFTLQWILAIHIPVLVIIALRFISGLGFEFITYPVLVGAFFGGQFLGKLLNKKFSKINNLNISSCIVMDVIRNYQLIFNKD